MAIIVLICCKEVTYSVTHFSLLWKCHGSHCIGLMLCVQFIGMQQNSVHMQPT